MSDTLRDKILDAALSIAAFDGWTPTTLREAALKADVPEGSEELAFPGGPVEALSHWSARCDGRAKAKITALDLKSMKIRDRITQAVIMRLSEIEHDTAAQRAMSRFTLPDAGAAGAKAVWASADMIWRAIGDTSTDGNFYSKRTVLSGVIGSTLPVWLADNDPEKLKARAFLDARIANVMQFEKLKAQGRKLGKALPDPVAILSRLRYGKGRRRY